jgi:hypothetical protein
LTVLVRPRKRVRLVPYNKELEGFEPPSEAVDAFYVNPIAAERLGLDKTGWIGIIPENSTNSGESLSVEAWNNRFFEGKIAADRQILKVLTQRSALPRIHELAQETQALFFALLTHLGPLVLLAAERGRLDSATAEISALPLTFDLSRK